MKQCRQCKKNDKCNRCYSRLSNYAEICENFDEILPTNFEMMKTISSVDDMECLLKYIVDKASRDDSFISNWLKQEVSKDGNMGQRK